MVSMPPGTLLSPPPQLCDSGCTWLVHPGWGLNSGLLACLASPLPTELSSYFTFQLLILLPLIPRFWDCRYALMMGIKPKASACRTGILPTYLPSQLTGRSIVVLLIVHLGLLNAG